MHTNNCLNGVPSSFNPLHKEFSPSLWLVNISNCFSFNTVDYKSNDAKSAHLYKLNEVFQNSLQDTKIIVVISNVSIKKNITTFIAHVHSRPNIIAKTIYYVVNVISTKVELFAIRCRINQVVQVTDTSYIIVVTDTIYLTRHIFDSWSHTYQL